MLTHIILNVILESVYAVVMVNDATVTAQVSGYTCVVFRMFVFHGDNVTDCK